MERKVSAWMQIRLGPNRVGPKGMFQTVADTLKLIVKEGMTPNGADKFLIQPRSFYCDDRCNGNAGTDCLQKISRSGI